MLKHCGHIGWIPSCLLTEPGDLTKALPGPAAVPKAGASYTFASRLQAAKSRRIHWQEKGLGC